MRLLTAIFLETNVEGCHYVLEFLNKFVCTFGGIYGHESLGVLSENTLLENGDAVGKTDIFICSKVSEQWEACFALILHYTRNSSITTKTRNFSLHGLFRLLEEYKYASKP